MTAAISKNTCVELALILVAANDPLQITEGTVRPWDLPDGDAQMMAGVESNTFDFVYSSHCLEHMHSVPQSLLHWSRILKPGGWLYIVIPDYVLYEKMTWPSQFNPDHKQSFSGLVTRDMVRRPNHWHMDQDMAPLIAELKLADYRWEIESRGFNFNAGIFDQTARNAIAQIYFVARKSF